MATADLLFVASEPREFEGLLPRCQDVRSLAWPVDWARAATLGGRRVVLVANGVGARRAADAVDAAVARGSFSAVASIGYCGALSASLQIGEVIVATAIETGGCQLPVMAPRAGRPCASGAIVSVDRVALTAAEKSALRAGGADAVEMEAAGVAEAATRLGLAVYCIRSVTDMAGESFLLDFNAALREDGHFDTGRILGQVLRKPAALPELIRLRRRCQTASRNLGEFLADCRF